MHFSGNKLEQSPHCYSTLNECFRLVKNAYIVGAKKFSFTDRPSGKL